MIRLKCKGDFKKSLNYMDKLLGIVGNGRFDIYGQMGVEALSAATPKNSGKTSESWGYDIQYNGTDAGIYWTNSNINEGVNIAVIIQYGHGTGWGGYVKGIDYINPAIRPVFEKMTNDLIKEVKSA